MALNERQKKFADEYLVDLNATQAAIRAGYSEKTAGQMGQENLKKPEIQAYIEKRRKSRIQRTEITQDFVLMELMKIAKADGTQFAEIRKRGRVYLVPTEELTPEQRAAVASVKKGKNGTEIKTYDKVRALELLGKHLGMFDGKSGQETGKENNLLQAIVDSAGEDLETDDLPEVQ